MNMNNESNFYLTLLSNSSKLYFPQNTSTHFCTQLPKTIHLDGEWVVGLAELQYPCSFLSLQENENNIKCRYAISKPINNDVLNSVLNDERFAPYFRKRMTYFKYNSIEDINFDDGDVFFEDSLEYSTSIDAGNYESIESILDALNKNEYLMKDEVKFSVADGTNKIHVSSPSSTLVSIILSPKLSLQLGFEPNANVLNKTSTHPSNILLGLPSHFFLYCDIIEPQLIGDVLAKVLRVVVIDNSEYHYGTHRVQFFLEPHYIPVLKREFENIEIDIRTDTGDKIPFQFGTVCIKLHFRRLK